MHRTLVWIGLTFLCGIAAAQEMQSASVGPVFKLEKTEYDLGTIGPEQEEVVGNVVIVNAGQEPLEIKRVASPGMAFSEYFGDTTIAPSKEGVLFISFYKNKIAKGKSRQTAQIQTNDPKKPYAAVAFNFIVEHSPEQAQQYQLYREIDSLRQEVRALRQELKSALKELKESQSVPSAQLAVQSQKAVPDTMIYNIETGDSPVLGGKDPNVTIVEFIDFQCPYCIREYPILKEILKEYPDQVRLVFKHYPLSFHTKAKPAHAAAELARRQLGNEGFWKMHDLIIANPKKLESQDILDYAEQVGLDIKEFKEVLDDPLKMDALLTNDMAQAKKCGVTGTPTILINGLKLSNRTPEGYRQRINQILKK